MSKPRTELRHLVEGIRENELPIVRKTLLHRLFDGLEGDELDVIGLLIERVAQQGVAVYGHLDVESDARDFVGEARDEVLDGLWYAGCELLRRERGTGSGESGASRGE